MVLDALDFRPGPDLARRHPPLPLSHLSSFEICRYTESRVSKELGNVDGHDADQRGRADRGVRLFFVMTLFLNYRIFLFFVYLLVLSF